MKQYKNHPLANYTSLKVGGSADIVLITEDGDQLISLLQQNTSPLHILGKGTNSLISDQGLRGTVIINQCGTMTIDDHIISVDSGVDWDTLVRFSIKNNLYGFEFMSGIPGTVGGAIVGNIAAYGQKIADTLIDITVYDTFAHKIKTLTAKELDLTYRSSNLQQNSNLIVVNARFGLSKSPTMHLEYESALKVAAEMRLVPHSLKDRRLIIMETRKRAGSLLINDQENHATAGSFFRNPLVNEDQVEKIVSYEEAGISKDKLLRQNTLHSGESTRVSAAHVLLAAGFKRGQTWGKVRLHPDHILKLENTGGAKAQDIYDVVELIIATVQSKLGIELEPEVRFLGKFN